MRQQQHILLWLNRRQQVVQTCMISCLLLLAEQSANGRHNVGNAVPVVKRIRSCRRLARNPGWWDLVWTSYTEKRFKKTFRVSKGTFRYILSKIRRDLEKHTMAEDPISPECRLAVCLYRLERGDYYYTISEMTGYGVATVCSIVVEVSKSIVTNLWGEAMDVQWQSCAFAAVDRCHLPIKCPSGGAEAAKE